MNEYVRYSIDARKKAIFDTYTVEKENNLKLIDDLFEKIEKLGLECQDSAEFESKFSASELQTEYTNLFVELHKSEKNNYYQQPEEDSFKDIVGSELKDEAKYQARQAAGSAIYGTLYRAVGDNNPELKNLVTDIDIPIIDDIFN